MPVQLVDWNSTGCTQTSEMDRQTPCPSTLLSPDICGHALRYSMAAGETHTHTHVSALASSFFNRSWMWVWQKILVTIRFLNTQQPEISSDTQWIRSILGIARLCCIVKLHCSLGSADATWAQSSTHAPPLPPAHHAARDLRADSRSVAGRAVFWVLLLLLLYVYCFLLLRRYNGLITENRGTTLSCHCSSRGSVLT